jgi:hypothetical protein
MLPESAEAPKDELDYEAVMRWVLDTCLLFGAQPETAAAVAGHFVAGLRGERFGC